MTMPRATAPPRVTKGRALQKEGLHAQAEPGRLYSIDTEAKIDGQIKTIGFHHAGPDPTDVSL